MHVYSSSTNTKQISVCAYIVYGSTKRSVVCLLERILLKRGSRLFGRSTAPVPVVPVCVLADAPKRHNNHFYKCSDISSKSNRNKIKQERGGSMRAAKLNKCII